MKYTKNMSAGLVTLSIAMVLGACSSTPTRNSALDEARATVQQAEAAPNAGTVAPQEIDAAHDALRTADALAAKHESAEKIDHAAYLAQRHAQIALEKIADANAQKVVADGQMKRQQAVLEGREREASAAAARNQEQAAVAKGQARAAQELSADLQRELEDLRAKKTDRGMVLTLGDVLFDVGKSTLKPGANNTLDRLASFLKDSMDSSVLIEGYTDSMGSDSYNMTLSQQRADAVRTALLERNVEAPRIESVGKGESQPVANNDTAAGRQLNRRVEIVIRNVPSQASNKGVTGMYSAVYSVVRM